MGQAIQIIFLAFLIAMFLKLFLVWQNREKPLVGQKKHQLLIKGSYALQFVLLYFIYLLPITLVSGIVALLIKIEIPIIIPALLSFVCTLFVLNKQEQPAI